MTQRKNNTPYTAREKEKALKLLQRTKDMIFVAHRYHCTVRTLYRWKRSYDGTLESLENKSSRPHSVHPRAHTPEEVNLICSVTIDVRPKAKKGIEKVIEF